jgi:hypothetical protein
MRKFFLILLCTVLCGGCASTIPRGAHTAVLSIGQPKDDIVYEAQLIFGSPAADYIIREGVPAPVEVVVFEYLGDGQVYLCFYNNIFFQAILIGRDQQKSLEFRPDYKNPAIGDGYPRGYWITQKKDIATIETIF